MKAQYTGFEPRGDITYNPSWDVASAAAEISGTSAQLLPVSLDVLNLVFEGFVIHFGVAATREYVEFERYAHNIKKIETQDSVKIFENGKTAYETQLDLGQHIFALNESKSDWSFRESRDAGTFVCNSLYYSSLAQNLNRLFIHVPMMKPESAQALGRKIGLHFDKVSF